MSSSGLFLGGVAGWYLATGYQLATLATCTFIPGPSGAHLCRTSLVKDKRDIPEQVSAI